MDQFVFNHNSNSNTNDTVKLVKKSVKKNKTNVILGYGIKMSKDDLINYAIKHLSFNAEKKPSIYDISLELRRYKLRVFEYENDVAILVKEQTNINNGINDVNYNVLDVSFSDHMKIVKIANDIKIKSDDYDQETLEKIRSLEELIPGDNNIPRALLIINKPTKKENSS